MNALKWVVLVILALPLFISGCVVANGPHHLDTTIGLDTPYGPITVSHRVAAPAGWTYDVEGPVHAHKAARVYCLGTNGSILSERTLTLDENGKTTGTLAYGTINFRILIAHSQSVIPGPPTGMIQAALQYLFIPKEYFAINLAVAPFTNGDVLYAAVVEAPTFEVAYLKFTSPFPWMHSNVQGITPLAWIVLDTYGINTRLTQFHPGIWETWDFTHNGQNVAYSMGYCLFWVGSFTEIYPAKIVWKTDKMSEPYTLRCVIRITPVTPG